MAFTPKDFTTIRNDTFLEVTFSAIRDGLPIDLAGATIRMMLRLVKASDPVALSLSTPSSGITITDAANGDFKIDEQIISIDAASYFYDMEIEEASGLVTTVLGGNFIVQQDVTY